MSYEEADSFDRS